MKALALHGVGHAHSDHLALVPAGVARCLGVEPLLHAAVEVPYALDWKDTKFSYNIMVWQPKIHISRSQRRVRDVGQSFSEF